MTTLAKAVAFFDIGNTLAAVRLSATGDRIEELLVYPDVPPMLEALRAAGVRLGILSNRGQIPEANVNEALERAGLLAFFERDFILYGPKDSPRLFKQAATRVRRHDGGPAADPAILEFVGEDAAERAYARAAHFLVAPHPRLALSVLRSQGPLRYLRIHVPSAATAAWRAPLRDQALVPLHLTTAPVGETQAAVLYAIADAPTTARLDDLGFWVDRLGAEDEPLDTDLYILRDDRQAESGFLAPAGSSFDFFSDPRSAGRVLTSTAEGLFVTIPGGQSVESYHLPGAQHGHNLKLIAAPALLESPVPDENPRLAATAAAWAPATHAADTLNLATSLTTAEKTALNKHITTNRLKQDVARYAGLQAVGTITIHSRHIQHPGNQDAVRVLVADLAREGAGRLTVRTHRFTHEGHPYDNVEARLPAAGRDGIVLITAHMDSTGARQSGYRPAVDAAPGADDDASGMAGVLAAARALLDLAGQGTRPRRELRFVLFNAEEHGLVGSRAYARDQARLGARIVAVFQMDMIGYDVNPGRVFELHAGFTPAPAVQTRSATLAALLAALVPQIAPGLPAPQLYPNEGAAADPAEGRSDHYSFQAEGYAACLASEDFFVGPGPAAPAPEPNPNYHLPADNAVNAAYAADIARAVAAAAWVAATR